MTSQRPENAADRSCVIAGRKRLFIRIAHAETAAEIKIAQLDSGIGKVTEMAHQARERTAEGSEVQNLRTDMSADAAPFDPARIPILQIQSARSIPIDAEFVAVVASGDVRMAARFDVGGYADGRWRGGAGAGCLRRGELGLL